MKDAAARCLCGRRGKRLCPPRNGVICTACCGSKRGGEIQCAADCPHFPFGVSSYDLWLRLDGSWMLKVARHVADRIGRQNLRGLAIQNRAGRDDEDDDVFAASFGVTVYQALFHTRDAEGKTLADRWEEDGWRGLNNDERVMMRYRRHSFAAIVELQQILDDQRLRCVDLLDEDAAPFVAFDRSMAQSAAPYDCVLTWLCHYPHYSRLGPAGVFVPRNMVGEFLEELRLRTEDAGENGLKDYLALHFAECCELLTELNKARVRRTLGATDIHHCILEYDYIAPRSEVEAVLREKIDFELTEEGDPAGTRRYSWLRRGESKELERDMSVLFRSEEGDPVGSVGNVELRPDCLVVETFSKLKHGFAKRKVESYFAGLVAFRRETVSDLAKQLAERVTDPDSRHGELEFPRQAQDPVPLEVEREIMQGFFRRHYRRFLDAPVPMLGGMTPREAAQRPAMRQPLVDLMKLHLNSIARQSRDRGIDLGIDWVIEELGLTELRDGT